VSEGYKQKEATASRFCLLAGLTLSLAVDGSFVSYKGIQGGFEEPWNIVAWGSAEESGILQRHGQGCVGSSRGLGDPKLPLWAPTGVQLAPTAPKLVEGEFSEVRTPHSLGPPPVGIPSGDRLPWGLILSS
jgi:hypothetical protein